LPGVGQHRVQLAGCQEGVGQQRAATEEDGLGEDGVVGVKVDGQFEPLNNK